MELTIGSSTVVFVDTSPFIYFFEKNIHFFDKMADFFDQIYQADAAMVTSFITYIEIATVPARKDDRITMARYQDFFTNSNNLSLLPIDLSISDETVNFRSKYNLKTPDAIQLATAFNCGADYVVTNDVKWKEIKELNVILVNEL